MTHWHATREVIAETFDRHDFALKWSYVEIAPLIVGLGYDWAVEQTAKCIDELVALVRPDEAAATKVTASAAKRNAKGTDLFPVHLTANPEATYVPPPVTITCKSGDNLDHIAENSIDLVVMDPPYYDNVMYAELSDFFYVWLKRTAGYAEPASFVASSPTKITKRSPTLLASKDRRVRRRSPDATTRSGWERFLQNAAGY